MARIQSATARLTAARQNRYKVIHERNLILRWAIAAAGVEAHLEPLLDKQDGYYWAVLVITTEPGQLTFKLTTTDKADFQHLQMRKTRSWDGQTYAQKIGRLEALAKIGV